MIIKFRNGILDGKEVDSDVLFSNLVNIEWMPEFLPIVITDNGAEISPNAEYVYRKIEAESNEKSTVYEWMSSAK